MKESEAVAPTTLSLGGELGKSSFLYLIAGHLFCNQSIVSDLTPRKIDKLCSNQIFDNNFHIDFINNTITLSSVKVTYYVSNAIFYDLDETTSKSENKNCDRPSKMTFLISHCIFTSMYIK